MTVFEFASKFPSNLEMPEIRRKNYNFAGQDAPLIFESVPTSVGRFLTFRPEFWSRDRALTLGEPFDGDEKDVLRPWNFTHRNIETTMPTPIDWAGAGQQIESEAFGMLQFTVFSNGYSIRFFGSRGLLYFESHTNPNVVFMGGMVVMEPTPHEWDYDPLPQFPRWSSGDSPVEKLAHNRPTEWQKIGGKNARAKNLDESFVVRWKALNETERRAFLPVMEQEIEAEMLQIMRWVLRADPSFQERNLEDARYFAASNRSWRKNHKLFWRCPRFLVSGGEKWGELQPEIWALDSTRTFIQKIWPQIAGAFQLEIEELRAFQAEVHPVVWKWCHWRGAYTVVFEASTSRHEQIEALASLNTWFKNRTGSELRIGEE